MNKLFKKIYEGKIDVIEAYGLPQNDIFRKTYKEWSCKLVESENTFLKNIDKDKKQTYLDLIDDRACLEMLEINAMFIEGIRVGLDIRGRKGKIKAVKKAEQKGINKEKRKN